MHMQLADLSELMQPGKLGLQPAGAGSSPAPLDAAQPEPELSEGPAAATPAPEQVGTAQTVAVTSCSQPNSPPCSRESSVTRQSCAKRPLQLITGADTRLSRQQPPPQRDGRASGRQRRS